VETTSNEAAGAARPSQHSRKGRRVNVRCSRSRTRASPARRVLSSRELRIRQWWLRDSSSKQGVRMWMPLWAPCACRWPDRRLAGAESSCTAADRQVSVIQITVGKSRSPRFPENSTAGYPPPWYRGRAHGGRTAAMAELRDACILNGGVGRRGAHKKGAQGGGRREERRRREEDSPSQDRCNVNLSGLVCRPPSLTATAPPSWVYRPPARGRGRPSSPSGPRIWIPISTRPP